MRIRLARKIQKQPSRYPRGKFRRAMIRLGYESVGQWRMELVKPGIGEVDVSAFVDYGRQVAERMEAAVLASFMVGSAE